MNDYKNALPSEVDDHPDSGMPRQLRTQADNDRTLDEREASAAGIIPGEAVYGDDSANPNADDKRDSERA